MIHNEIVAEPYSLLPLLPPLVIRRLSQLGMDSSFTTNRARTESDRQSRLAGPTTVHTIAAQKTYTLSLTLSPTSAPRTMHRTEHKSTNEMKSFFFF